MMHSQDRNNSNSSPVKKSRLADGMQLVSFEMPIAWRQKIDRRVDAGEFDSFSAYMRTLVRRDLGVPKLPKLIKPV